MMTIQSDITVCPPGDGPSESKWRLEDTSKMNTVNCLGYIVPVLSSSSYDIIAVDVLLKSTLTSKTI